MSVWFSIFDRVAHRCADPCLLVSNIPEICAHIPPAHPNLQYYNAPQGHRSEEQRKHRGEQNAFVSPCGEPSCQSCPYPAVANYISVSLVCSRCCKMTFEYCSNRTADVCCCSPWTACAPIARELAYRTENTSPQNKFSQVEANICPWHATGAVRRTVVLVLPITSSQNFL